MEGPLALQQEPSKTPCATRVEGPLAPKQEPKETRNKHSTKDTRTESTRLCPQNLGQGKGKQTREETPKPTAKGKKGNGKAKTRSNSRSKERPGAPSGSKDRKDLTELDESSGDEQPLMQRPSAQEGLAIAKEKAAIRKGLPPGLNKAPLTFQPTLITGLTLITEAPPDLRVTPSPKGTMPDSSPIGPLALVQQTDDASLATAQALAKAQISSTMETTNPFRPAGEPTPPPPPTRTTSSQTPSPGMSPSGNMACRRHPRRRRAIA